MAQLQPARGTPDLLPAQMRRHRRIIDTAREIAARYGFAEMSTPIFEFTEVFARPIGEATDIVAKEMYDFETKGGDRVALRPEFTASLCRAFVEHITPLAGDAGAARGVKDVPRDHHGERERDQDEQPVGLDEFHEPRL